MTIRRLEGAEPPQSKARHLAIRPILRRSVVVILLAILWQGYAVWLGKPLLLPSFSDTLRAWWLATLSGELVRRVGNSLGILALGYGIGAALAALLVTIAGVSRWGSDVLSTLTAMLNPLPAITLLPLALLWFGLGAGSMLFVLVHAVLWPLALNAHAGFNTVPETTVLVGRNYGLRGIRLVASILLPAAFPSILNGLRVAWAFAWRALISAELVFGVTSGSGGLGWYIYERRNQLATADVFAGLLTVVMIGLAIEAGFRQIEARTVIRWGMRS